jgi:PAS domain S-box-containing protein
MPDYEDAFLRSRGTIIRRLTLAVLLGAVSFLARAQDGIQFTAAERGWVAANPVVKVGNEMDWPPFDFAEDGEPKGYSVDLVRLVAAKAGFEVEFVNGLTWEQLLERFKAGEIDVMPAIYESKEREAFALFTPSYFSQPSVMAVRASEDSIQSLSDLDGRKVAAIRGFMISETLREEFPTIERVPVNNVVEGMKLVSTGEADAFIDSLGVMSYVAQQNYVPNIRFLTRVPLQDLANPDLHMAVGKDQALLRGILAKGIRTVTTEESDALRQRWLHSELALAAPLAGPTLEDGAPFSWWVIPIAIAILIGLAALSRIVDRPVTEEEMAKMSGARRFWLAVTFSNLKISAKILIILVLVAATSVVLFGYMNYREARRVLRTESFNKLTAVREMKAQQVEDYFETIVGQVTTFSESRTVVEAMDQFKASFVALEAEAAVDHGAETPADPELIAYYTGEFFPRLKANTVGELGQDAALGFIPKAARSRHLQEQYTAENPHPTGEKHRLDAAADGSEYSTVHRAYHPIIRSFLERFGYYDIFLIDHETGHIVYSVFKEVDYATSLLTGPYRKTNFATAFRRARDASRSGFAGLEDFAPYQPSYNAPASFIASPIFDGNKKIGVLIFQMPIDHINGIMTSHQAWKDVGLGESGETYLVGKDYLMRNQSRFLIEDRENYLAMVRDIGLSPDAIRQIEALNTSIGLQRVETKGTKAALAGQTNTEIFPDYRGISVLSSYRMVTLPDVRWAIMSEIDEEEAMAPAERLKARSLMLMVLFLGAILAISFAFAKTMTRPIKVLTAKANALAEGDLGVSISIGGGDEIAQLGRSFDVMRKALAELIGGLEEKVEERTAELASKTEMLETTIESLTHPFYVINAEDHSIALMNSAAGTMEGDAPKTCYSLTHRRDTPCDGGDDPCPLEMVKQTGKPVVVEHTHYDSEGHPRFAEVHGYPIFDADGNVTQMIEYSLDITDRKQAEAQLRLQSAALMSAANAIVITDPQGCIEWVNPAYTALTGYSEAEALGKNPRILNSGTHEKAFFTRMWDTINNGRTWRDEIVNRRKDGSLYTEEMTITPVRTDEGAIASFVAIKQDITARKEAERALADQLAFNKALVDTIPSPVFVKDREARFVMFNRAYEQAFGMQRDDYIGKTTHQLDYIPEEERQALHEEDITLLETGGMHHRDLATRYADGTDHDVLYWVTRFELADGGVGGILGVFVDISEQKELEKKLAKANARMSGELNVAREIQMNMVPLTFPAFPDRPEFTIHAALEPAREVGGDFYDFYFVSDDWLLFCVGDVSDKGVPAALFMAVTQTLIKSRASDDISPARILSRVNDELSADNASCMFVTLFVAFLNVKTGKLLYTNAGHNPPYIKRRAGQLDKLSDRHGPVIGAMPDLDYGSSEAEMEPGDLFVLFTDGVTEARGVDTGLYGEDRLEALLASFGGLVVEEVVEQTVDAVQSFQGRDHQADDITVLALEFVGPPVDDVLRQLDVTIKNQVPEIDVVDRQLADFASSVDLPRKIAGQVRLSCDELLNNVISYAYSDDFEHEIRITMLLTASQLTITIADDGDPFNPFDLDAPDTEASLEDREIGGLGVHLVRNVMTEVSYQRLEGRNVVTLIKELGSDAQPLKPTVDGGGPS